MGLAILLAAGAAGFGLRGGRLKKERRLAQQEQERLRLELVSVRQRLALAEQDLNLKRKEILTRREKTSGRKLRPGADCQQCLEQISLGLEVQDEERGWWIFRDPELLDGVPGELTLTPKFWQDNLSARPVSTESAAAAGSRAEFFGAKRWRTEKELRLAVNLTGYEAEFAFSPLVLSGRRWQARLSLNSRLEFNRLDSNLRGDLSAGLAFRW